MDHAPVFLLDVSDVSVTDNGDPYFRAVFKRGFLGRTVSRTFWGTAPEEGCVQWDRIAPEDLTHLKGSDLSGEVEIEDPDRETKQTTYC